jgi:CheY-like chemotaxis protein
MRRALEAQHAIEVVGQAGTARKLWSMVEPRTPNVVLLDLHMPGAADVSFISQIRDRWPDVKVVALSHYEDRGLVSAALSAGATSCFRRGCAHSSRPPRSSRWPEGRRTHLPARTDGGRHRRRGAARPAGARGKACGAALALAVATASPLLRPSKVLAPLAAFAGVALVLIAMFDIEHRIGPNRVVLSATAVVLLTRALIAPGHVAQYVLAALAAAAFLAVPRLVSRSAVGTGDVKLALLIGVTLA